MSVSKIYFSLCLVVFLIVSTSSCAFVSIPFGQSTQPFQETVISGDGSNKILMLDISGVISEKNKSQYLGLSSSPNMLSRIKEELDLATKDPAIKALIVKINTPGGTVTASDIIYNEIKKYKKKTGVKVVAIMMDLATSGGYYIASAADKIMAHPTTITGSIGVIVLNFKLFRLMDKIGIENETIKSGAKKDIMSPFRASTIEEKKIIQNVVDSLHERFVNVVAEGRKELNIDEVKKIADGRIYTAREAYKLKLIDNIGYVDDAIELARNEANIANARVIRYSRPFAYSNNIYSKFENPAVQNFNLINFDMFNLMEGITAKFMYLWMS